MFNQNNCYILIIPGFGIVSTAISASSNKNVFGQDGPLIVIIQLMQRTVYGEFFSSKNLRIYLLLLNNPQITKTLSKNVLLKLNRINYLLASIASNELVLKFSQILLNISNNFLNSFIKYIVNTNKLHLIHTITHSLTNIHNLSFLTQKLFFSVLRLGRSPGSPSTPPNKNGLHPYYITGFVDGEGCFSINVRPRPNRGKGYAVELVFKITLSSKDKLLLENIKNYFNVGRLLTHGSNTSYCVKSLNELQVIVNHFDNYPLISNK